MTHISAQGSMQHPCLAIDRPVRDDAVVARFDAVVGLDADARELLATAAECPRVVQAHREMLSEGRPITETLLVLDGWGARVRNLADGRRQILSFVLPGDMLGACDHAHPVMSSTIVALTTMTCCPAPARDASPVLDQCYGVSRAIDEANLLAQITRLGRLSAYERIIDLLLELSERLELAARGHAGHFHIPLTQEMLADALGLTSVHINRMLQQARRSGDLRWRGREITLRDPAMLTRVVGRRSVQVSA